MNLKIFVLYYSTPQPTTFSYSTNATAARKFNLRYYFVLYIIKNKYVIAVHTTIY